MNKKENILDFLKVTKKFFNLDERTQTSLKNFVKSTKNHFAGSAYHLKVIGDYAAQTMTRYDDLNLSFAVIKYSPASRSAFWSKFFDHVLKILQKNFNPNAIFDRRDEGFFGLKVKINDRVVRIRFILFLKHKSLYNKTSSYYISRNKKERLDNVIPVLEAFNKINRISSGAVRGLVKLIKYCLGKDFNYNYILYVLILRWFYEYFLVRYKKYIANLGADNKALNTDQFMSTDFLKKWYFKNIKTDEILFFILDNILSKKSYFIQGFNFQEEEIFESISRYSWEQNGFFMVPVDYYLGFRILNLHNYEDLEKAQELIRNEKISRLEFDRVRNNDESKYLVTPIIAEGPVGFVDYAVNFQRKSHSLFRKLSKEKRRNAVSIQQREIMEELNFIANKWLSAYRGRMQYAKFYFDHKYAIVSNLSYFMRVQSIIHAIDNIRNQDFVY